MARRGIKREEEREKEERGKKGDERREREGGQRRETKVKRGEGRGSYRDIQGHGKLT